MGGIRSGAPRWKPLLYAALAALLVYLPIVVSGSGGWELIYWLLVTVFMFGSFATAPFLALAGKWRNSLLLLGMATACLLVSFFLFWKGFVIRTYARWAFHSGTYKREVLAQHGLAPEVLRHIGWDSWGMAGQDTFAYLVYDPKDRLRYAVRTGEGYGAAGLPCDVWQVLRLEKQWYAVVFFTNTGWQSR